MTEQLIQPVTDLTFFPLGEAYEYGRKIHADLVDKLEGRVIDDAHDMGVLVQAAINGKHCNHIEIGTFFGASAIAVAVAKKHFHLHGKVICVDPLECRTSIQQDGLVKRVATSHTLMENAGIFGVADRIELVAKSSRPWPIVGQTFGTGYIDGDHWNGFPLSDWAHMSKCVSYSIVMDDYCWGKTEVVDAVLEASNDPRWLLVHVSGKKAVLRRRH